MTTLTDPAGPVVKPARSDQQLRLGAALRASNLPALARLAVWACADIAAAAAVTGATFTISITEIADATGMTLEHTARAVSDLITAGWITRGDTGLLTVGAPRTGE